MKISRYFTGVILIIMMSITSLTSARFLPENGERVKRQTADVKIAEYNALLALSRRLHSYCKKIACGLVDVVARLIKRIASDQRLAELQAWIGLSKGDTVVGHGKIDPRRIGRKKRSLRTLLDDLDEAQRLQYLDMLLAEKDDEPLK